MTSIDWSIVSTLSAIYVGLIFAVVISISDFLDKKNKTYPIQLLCTRIFGVLFILYPIVVMLFISYCIIIRVNIYNNIDIIESVFIVIIFVLCIFLGISFILYPERVKKDTYEKNKKVIKHKQSIFPWKPIEIKITMMLSLIVTIILILLIIFNSNNINSSYIDIMETIIGIILLISGIFIIFLNIRLIIKKGIINTIKTYEDFEYLLYIIIFIVFCLYIGIRSIIDVFL